MAHGDARVQRAARVDREVPGDSGGRAKEADVIRVLLADDNAFVRNALVELLGSCEHMEVVAACADGDEVPAAAEASRPDVVLLDVAMPVSGLEAARRLLAVDPQARIVFLTADSSAASVRQARDMGAMGYLLKGLAPDELCAEVCRVAAGHTAWRQRGTGNGERR